MVENVLSARELATVRQVTDELVAASRAVTEHNQIYDLEPTHTPGEPRVRRIKEPHNVHPAFREIAFSKKIADILTPLIGPSGIRYQTGKLNMKAAGYGAAVEWHQDWAFYPHTNDDLLAIGIYLDDCGPDNGPLMVVPGSHRWPIADHHSEGVFCGAIDPTSLGHRLLEGRDADRHGGQHDHPPRAHGSRLGAEHLRPAAAAPAVPVHRGRRLPAPGHPRTGRSSTPTS